MAIWGWVRGQQILISFKDLNEPESLLFTESQNSITLKLLLFRFQKFGRISHIFPNKNEIYISRKKIHGLQFWFKMAEIFTR